MNEDIKEKKICPLNWRPCAKQLCALWIEIVKDNPIPIYIVEYRGCGLINHIPWRQRKIETPAGGVICA